MNRNELAVESAWLYYEFHLNQGQIAKQLGVSRSSISRALQDAERRGIVRHLITTSLPRLLPLEAEILARTSLTACRIVPDTDGIEVVARAAAVFVDDRLEPDHTIALGWGRTIRAMSENLPPRPLTELTCVDAIGHANVADAVDALGTTQAVAARYHSRRVHHLVVPAMVHQRSDVVDSSGFDRVLQLSRAADLVVVSVGSVDEQASMLKMTDLVDRSRLAELAAAGAIGDITGHFIDRDGNGVIGGPHVLGLSLADLRMNPNVVVVTAGPLKNKATAAAVRGGLANAIVCDEGTARFILATIDD